MNELHAAITQATSVLVVVPQKASDKDYLAALQIQKLAPEKVYLIAPEEKETVWHDTFGIPLPKKEYVILVDTRRSPVEELRYEKTDDSLTIFLSHRKTFSRDALSFQERIPTADLIITVGFSSEEESEQFIENLPQHTSTQHLMLDEYMKPLAQEKISTEHAQLLGRIMARSREEADLETLWSFLTREDLVKTNAKGEDIPELVQKFADLANLPRIVIIFWQLIDEDQTTGILWSKDSALLVAASSRLGSVLPQKQYILLPEFENFVDGEGAIRKLLHSTR
ncbi:MAG: hypothetical protein AAB372_01615 [Patescibacteria group bacterium]